MKIVIFFLIFITTSFSLNIDTDELDINEGKFIYEQTCSSCHGSDGKAQTNMNLVVKPRNLTKSILNQNQIFNVIKFGSHKWGSKSDIMPSFESVYNHLELNNIAYYVFETFGKKQNNVIEKLLLESNKIKESSPKVGQKIFMRNCSLCHGIHGDGKSDFVEKSKSNSSFIYPYNLQKIILTEEQIFLYAKFGGKFWGTNKNDMPSWKQKYNDAELKSVAKYIKNQIKINNQKQ